MATSLDNTSEVYMSIEELAEELSFQKLLLSTIDDFVPNKENAIAEIKKDIASLKRRLQEARGARASSQQHSSNPGSQPSSFPKAPASIDDDPFAEPPSTVASKMPSNFSSTTSTSQAGRFLPQPNSLGKHTYSDNATVNRSNKSRRTISNTGTRTSIKPEHGFGGKWDDDVIDITNDSDNEETAMERYRERQSRAEAAAKREREDHRYAMQLQNDMSNNASSSNYSNSPAFGTAAASRSNSNAYNRLMGPQPTQQYGSSHSSSSRPIKNEQSSAAIPSRHLNPGPNGAHRPINAESSYSRIPGAFPDDPVEINDTKATSYDAFGHRNRPHTLSQSYQSGPYQPAMGSVYGNTSPYSRNNGQSFNAQGSQTLPGVSLIGSSSPQYGSMRYSPNNSGYTVSAPYSYLGSAISYSHILDDNFLGASTGYSGHRVLPWGQDGLSSIINRTAGIDYSKGLDMYGNPLDPRAAAIYDYVNDPRKTEQEIKDLLENIRPDMDIPKQDREGTPDQLVCALYEHQKLALAWMKSMEEGTNKGGILADDMGLGKTISTLALMVSRPSEDRRRKTTLIVGPVALVRQWQEEIKRRIKVEHRLSVYLYHGNKTTWDHLRTHDVVLTTYGTLAAEYKRLEKAEEERRMNPATDDEWREAGKKKFPFLGPASMWYRVVLDEAQCIKNKNTQSSQAASNLKALSRFCLTGTPMMNGVFELFSLIKFLRIKPYNEQKRFTQDFGALQKSNARDSETKAAMRRLQALLKAILLRRTKTSKVDGEPILKSLPPKEEVIDHVIFSEDEKTYYRSLETKSQISFNKYLKAGTVGKNYSNILVLLLRLRQCCCHPHLIMDFEEAPTAIDMSLEDMDSLAKTLAPDVVGRIKEADGTGFECPVCYDINLNPRFVLPCGHDTCSDCLTKITDQASQEGSEARCPTCRGKINIKQIIDYMAFKRVHMPVAKGLTLEEASDDVSDSDSETNSDTDSDEDDLPADLRNFIVPDDVDDDDDDETQSEDDGKLAKQKPAKKAKKSSKSKPKRRDIKGKGKAKEDVPHTSLAMLKKESARNAENRRKYMRYLKKNWQPSAKVNKCCELIKEVTDTTDEKIIIFSQWTSLLDLLEIPIKHELDIGYQRYDGSMSADARDAAAHRFNNSAECKIMLISLKAGNAGLNLVAASQVIILDPFWNPFIENQAVDRAHRIGQRKTVKVHRILIEETVEDRIIALQEKKRALVESALDEKASKNLGRLGKRELAYLFGVGGPHVPSTSD